MTQSFTRSILRAFLCLAAVLAPISLPAATINVPADQKTIQAGMDAASPGDTVLVAPGTYKENIDFKGKAITVTSSGGPASTIIDGGGKTGFATVTFATGETRASVISNMTIRNGGSASQDSFIENSGGVFTYLSSPSILNNIITANNCNGVVDFESSPLIQGNTISATIGVSAGACRLEKGPAIEQLGANYLATDGSVTIVRGNIIENNTDGIYGTTGDIDFFGGDGSIVQGNIIRNNIGTDAGAISMVNMNTISILQNLVYGNSAGGAGAFNLLPPESSVGPFTGIIASNTIADNTVTYGNTYSGDTVSSQIFISGNLAQWVFVNNVIVGNKAGTTAINCDVGYSYLSVTPLVFDHNDVYSADGVSYAGNCDDQTGSYGNIDSDPRFISPSTGNYQLTATSPAVDSGNNSAPFLLGADFIGKARVQDATAKGFPVVDMGAYELAGLQALAPTTLTLTPSVYYYPIEGTNLGPFDQTPLTFTIALTSAAGTPSGPVTIYQDDAAIATVNVGASGSATYDGANVTPGLHAYVAKYAGEGEYPAAVSVKFYEIIPLLKTTLALTSSSNPSQLGQNVTFTAQLSSTGGVPTGNVQFSDGGTVLGTETISGTGVSIFDTTQLAVGNHTITATYLPGGSSPAATATLNQIVNGMTTSTAISSSLNPANVGQTVSLTATVTSANGTPAGLVTFSDGATILGVQTLINGLATYTTSSLAAGTHQIAAAYNPTGTTYNSSKATLPQVIDGIATTTSLAVAPTAAVYGTNIAMTSTVNLSTFSNSPGSITFMDGTTVIATGQLLPSSSTSSYNDIYLAVGIHTITSVYSGDASHSASTSPAVTVTITAAKTTLALSVTPSPGFALQPITLTAKLAGAPAGSGSGSAINFLANGKVIGSATTDIQGSATFPASLVTGNYTLTAAFAGNAGLAASTSAPVAEIINPNATSTAVYAQPSPGYQGGNETVTATVTTLFSSSSTPPVPIGTVAFFDAGVLFATANLDASGQANFSTETLTVGSHSIVASYLGTPNFLNSTSSPYILNILPRDFTLATDPTLTIQTQHNKELSLTLSSIGDFTDTVALSCANLPAYATCTFPSNGQNLVAGVTQASSVHVDTDALLNYISSNAPAGRPQDSPRSGRGVAYGLLLPVTLIAALRRRRKLRRIMGLCIGISVLLIAMTFTGCSAHYPGHTPPGTYTFTITGLGVSTHISHTATVTLIVTE